MDGLQHNTYYFDRRDAGRDLARDLKGYRGRSHVIVLALPPGGVPVAYEIALALRAPLDVMSLPCLCVPDGGEVAIRALPLCSSFKGRIVVLVDDGSATEAMLRTAIAAVRQQQPIRVVVAVPVAAQETCEALRRDADEVHCGITPVFFSGIEQWYDRAAPITNAEAWALLHQHAFITPSRPSPHPRPQHPRVEMGIRDECPKNANAKVVMGLFVMVLLQVVLAGCPPRKPTPIAHGFCASYVAPNTVLSANAQGVSPAVEIKASLYAGEE